MGIEQGTPVVGSNFELPLNIDLPDLRLPRAFKAWKDFKIRHTQQIDNLGVLSVTEIVSLSDELSTLICGAVGVVSAESRHLSRGRITRLVDYTAGEGDRIIFMRHGEQSPPEWVFSIANPALRKIRMMQNPFNREDLLTNRALVDVFLTAFGLLYVKEVIGKEVRILSSENQRAKEPAEIISTIIPGSTFSTQEGLSCITYRDERDEPPISVEEILEEIPSGFMPWDRSLVDKLCKDRKKGIRQSEIIVQTIDGLIALGTQKEGNTLYIVLTHNQQLAEALRFVGELENPSARFPELTMLAINSPRQTFILNGGILSEEDERPRNRNMRKTLEKLGGAYEWYKVRRAEYATDQKIPFLVGSEPLYLLPQEGEEIIRIGKDVTDFMQAANELYRTETDVKGLLDRGKPKILQQAREARYLFIRPDLLITKDGFSVCEIETSPFGLALAELLNRAYRAADFATMAEAEVLKAFLADNTPPEGTIVYSKNTSLYAGQLQFLAREILSGKGRRWIAEQSDSVVGTTPPNIYRAFYQYEFVSDLFVNNLVQNLLETSRIEVMPSFTPHMEEKALLALIWDKRWETFLTKQLGTATLGHLREVIPPTWVVGQEQFFTLGLPPGVTSSEELASLSKTKRNFVLKKSGFGGGSSWAEGVTFLQEKSSDRARALLIAASQDAQSLYVVQEFRPSQERPMTYDKDSHTIEQMKARIRLTPYFSMIKGKEGKLLAIKATGCENTNYIHASTGSINTAVAIT